MMNPNVIEEYIVNFSYVVNDNRLGCFVVEKQGRISPSVELVKISKN